MTLAAIALAIAALLIFACVGLWRHVPVNEQCPDCGDIPGTKGWATPCPRCFAVHMARYEEPIG